MSLNDGMYAFYTSTGRKFGAAFTGFNELTVASSTPLIDLKSVYGISVLRDITEVTGSGSVTNNNKEYTISTGTTSGSTAVLETAERGRYTAGFEAVPGIGIRIPVTIVEDQVVMWGYFDDTDGFGTGIDSTGMFTFIRRAGSDTKTYSPSWQGPVKEIAIDLTQYNIYRYPFRWYGSGPIRFNISRPNADIDPGVSQYHIIANADQEPIVDNPNLPLRVEVDNGTTTDDVEVDVTGRQFFVQGFYNPSRRITSESRISQSVGSSDFVPLISWDQKDSFSSISVKLAAIEFLVSNNPIIYQIRFNSTLTGGTDGYQAPSNTSASETALEFDNDSTGLDQPGEKVFEGLANAGSGSKTATSGGDLPNLNLPYQGTVTLCAKGIGGTATVTSVLRATEEW